MPVSDVDIANMALGHLGQGRITSLSDNDECYNNYPICRDACLEDIDWTFAIERILLGSPDNTPPAWGYANRFLLPTRVLRVIEVNGNNYQWEREGNYIVTDELSLEVKAVVRVTDVRLFSPSFCQALSFRLAATIAIPITNSKTIAESWWQMYAAMRTAAQVNDGRQGSSQKIRRPKTLRGRT